MKKLIIALLLAVALPALAEECKTSVYFDTAKTDLTPVAQKSLDGIVACAGDKRAVRVDIVGSADVRKFNTNDKLSEGRAASVQKYLVAKGVKPALIVVQHVGDTKPVCTEKTPECLQQNRRADVSVIKEEPVVCPPVVICPPVPAPTVITKNVEVVKVVEKESEWEIMAYAQIGAHLDTDGYPTTLLSQERLHGEANNWLSWNLGTEFHLVPYRLGLRTGVGNNGISGLIQVFPIQGRLNWYVGAGMAYTQYPFYRPSVPEVQRYWDLQLGTGVEYAFSKHLVGLADLKTSIPLPWTNAPSLTWDNVGTAFGQTALMVGVGYRF